MARPSRRVWLSLLGLFVISLPWLCLIPGAVFPGVGVIERCDSEARDRFGKDEAFTLQGQEHVQWFPPGWRCPLSNGESIYLRPP